MAIRFAKKTRKNYNKYQSKYLEKNIYTQKKEHKLNVN